MDGAWLGGWAAADADADADADAERQLQSAGRWPSQGSQDLHAHRLGRAGAPVAPGVPRGLPGRLGEFTFSLGHPVTSPGGPADPVRSSRARVLRSSRW